MMPNDRRNFVIGFLVICTLQLASAELFTAIAEMEELLDTEAALISNLEAYIEAQEEKLSYLRR